MNSTGFGRWGWLLQLLVAICLILTVSDISAAATISGTVTNSTNRPGRVYMYLQQQSGGDTGLGVSVPTPAPGTSFAIRGVPNGSYILNAFVDGSGTGRLHANDPTWSSSGTININNSDYSGPNSTVTFTTRPNIPVQASGGAMIIPGDNGAFVGWDEPESNGTTIADAYKIYYSTTSTTPRTTPQGVITVPAGDQAFAVFHYPNTTNLNIQVTALVGATESAATTVASTTINPPAPGFSISGTIELPGISNPTGNLYVALIDRSGDGGGPVAVAYVANPPQLSNSFTINTNSANVPNATYALFAFIDRDGDGKFGSGDVMPNEHQAPAVTIDGTDITLDQSIILTTSNSSPFLNTSHTQDSSTPPNDFYQVIVGVEPILETLANITVTGGPASSGLSYPIDLGITNWGSFQSWLYLDSNRPQLTDIYNLSIQYANVAVGPDAVNLPVTAVLDTFATPTAPLGNLPYSSITNPSIFSWDAPTNPPASYTYSFWVTANGFNNNNDAYSDLSDTTTFLSIPGLTYSNGNTYNWNISVQDDAGNQAQKSASFVYTTSPAINSFTPSSVLVGASVTIYGINFNANPLNNSVRFNGTLATVTAASTTQLTVEVPPGATSGQISVQTSSGTGFSTSSIIVDSPGGDTQAPTIPTGVTATAIGPNQIDISWNISTDNVGVSYYVVYRDGSPAATPYGPNNTIWQDTFVVPNTTYAYTVAACDASNNCSFPSTPAQATTPGSTPSIGGRVTFNSNGVSGATVTIFNSSSLQYINSTTTDFSGNYTFGNLSVGSYKVQFIPPTFTGYDSIWYTGRHDGNSADTIVLADSTPFTANAALTAGQTGGISGRVTDGSNGIAGIWVGVSVASNMAYAFGTTTDNDGYYSIGGLISGSYKVYFSGNNVGYLNIWHSGSLSPDTATSIIVTAPTYFTDVNAVLTRAGAISGRVSNASFTGIANILVNVSDATTGTWLANAITDGNGDYTAAGLPAGDYKVYFDGSSAGYGRQWYDTKADISSATIVAVTAENTTAGINGVLPVGGSITGSVTAASVGLPAVTVTVYDDANIWITSTETDGSGAYIINGLPTGTYKLQYFKSGHTTQWYNNKFSQGTADAVTVTAPENTALSTVAMQTATVSASGAVYTTAGVSVPVAGATVSVVGNPALITTTDSNGLYTISGIPVNQDIQIMASMGGYVTAYSATFNSTGANINAREMILFTSAEVGAGITPSTGGIFGHTVMSGLGTYVEGATVSIVSPTGKYTVLYDDGTGTGNYNPGGATSANGRFFIPNITDGETVILSASKTGWSPTGQKTYVVHANAVSQGNLAGTHSTTTTVTQASGSNPSYYGDSLTFTATVSPSTATGMVKFKVDGVNVGSVTLINGSATSVAISSMTVAAHTVSAEYSGGTGYAVSVSAGLSQTVADKVQIGDGLHYLTLLEAITAAADKSVLRLRDTRFSEDLVININNTFSITLMGGLVSDFSTPAASATSLRKLNIRQGKLIAKRLVVKPD